MGGGDGDDDAVKSVPIFGESVGGERVVGAVVSEVVGAGVACEGNTNGCGALRAGCTPHVAQALTGKGAGVGARAFGVESDKMVSRSWPACWPWPC